MNSLSGLLKICTGVCLNLQVFIYSRSAKSLHYELDSHPNNQIRRAFQGTKNSVKMLFRYTCIFFVCEFPVIVFYVLQPISIVFLGMHQ